MYGLHTGTRTRVREANNEIKLGVILLEQLQASLDGWDDGCELHAADIT